MLSGAMTFGGIIAGIKSIIESNNLLGREVVERTNDLKEFLVDKSIPTGLTLASLDAFVYSLTNRPLLSDSGLYDIVPDKIRLQILKQQFAREVALIDILRRASFSFTAILLERFMPVHVGGGEIIYESGMPLSMHAITPYCSVPHTLLHFPAPPLTPPHLTALPSPPPPSLSFIHPLPF